MDSYEATRVVFTRIQSLDPEYASKIMGLLLIQDHGEKEMIRLAFGPESLVQSVILKARKELGISTPPTPSTPSSPSPFSSQSLSRQNSANSTGSRIVNGGGTNLPSPLSIPSLSSSWTNSNFSDFQPADESRLNSSAPPFYGGAGAEEPDLIDELQIQDQLSFLNDGSPSKSGEFYYPDLVSPNGGGGDMFSPWGSGGPHRRSSSVNDICLGGAGEDPSGWKPCLYYARGFCKNGASCRFTHGEADLSAVTVGSLSKLDVMEQCHELLRSKSAHQQRLLMAAAGGSPNFPFPNSPKSMNYLLQQQSDSPRMAAALMMGEDMNKFGRSRNEFSMGMLNPGSRQIYLTFPADSTFREEDVSNYFSMFGPVQDVRIPYQQKRMFGFVTFVYAETVKLILAKGNPHFVCDARVLVKPYKEKGKVSDKFRKQPPPPLDSPTGFDSPRDPFDLQLGARMLYNSQDLLWRKKLEEQADLQRAIELQNRRIMDLQLLDVKRSHHHHQRALSTGAAIPSPTCFSPSYLNHPSVFGSRSSSSPDSEDGLMSKMMTPVNVNGDEPLEANLNLEKEKETVELKDETSNGKSSPNHEEEEIDLPESLEHNLPDNLFASPKASGNYQTVFSNDDNTPVSSAPLSTSNSNLMTSPLLPASSTLDLASLKSCYFQFPRFSPGHGAIGM
ncbi:putative transcription factor C3H family [Helianthus annuus]|uniref:Putative zinc finger CCCH domain-containing protein 53 n=1 Tax=Helianthus annuus TaxID=4232 RepID=A0A251VQJ6_HELAN|nr:zinc finger CCCH domain-containing protein 53 [Helianthus annuus]KAF5822318.1 putative transcription factor C3H family [Helianthus annuus]KAJ0948289.1 putative transcription factor C3H family [Helianthus annuus]KAJ0957177.1 putative transcription factor C3H family [Helianthus annuus]